MNIVLWICLLFFIAQYQKGAQCQTYKEGYFINHPNNTMNSSRCLVQVTDTKEGTKEFTGDPGDEDQCDLFILQLTEGENFDNGTFTIQVKSSGVYLSEYNEAIGLTSTQQVFTAYTHGGGGCGCDLDLVISGINSLLNESKHIHVRFHNEIGPRCLNDVYYYDVYHEDDYGYLMYGWPYHLISECVTDWWFMEVVSNTTGTVEQLSGDEPVTEKSSSNALAIGLSLGLILTAVLCVGICFLVIYLIKKKKSNQTESAPDAATAADVELQ